MNISDILILLAVACAVAAAVLSNRRRKQAVKGTCGSGCENCAERSLCRK